MSINLEKNYEFTCPECGSHHFSSAKEKRYNGKITGYCSGTFLGHCNFVWDRKYDHLYFKPIKEMKPSLEKTIYDLKLHEQMKIKEDPSLNHLLDFGIVGDTYIKITKVPGGWIYEMSGDSDQALFIPYSEEFDPRKDHLY